MTKTDAHKKISNLMIYPMAALAGLLVLIIFLMWSELEADDIFLYMCLIGIASFSIIMGFIMKYRYKIESNGGLFSKLAHNITAYEKGLWYENELIWVAIGLTCVCLAITYGFVYIDGGLDMLFVLGMMILLSVLFLPMYYGSYKRYGWEIKIVRSLKYKPLIVIIKNLIIHNGYEVKEVKKYSAYLRHRECITLEIINTNLRLSIMDDGRWPFLAMGRRNANIKEFRRIQKLIDDKVNEQFEIYPKIE